MLTVATACSGASTPSKSHAVKTFPRRVDAAAAPSDVRGQLGDELTVTEIEAGIYKRESDGLLLGECAVLRPYIAKHGKPAGFICFT